MSTRPLLTPRRLQILAFIADGLTVEEIAPRVFMAKGTVHNHLLHIRRLLGATHNAHAVAIAMRRNLLT